MNFDESNLLIAKFMGWKIDNSFPDKGRVWRSPNGDVEMDTTFKFHKDWNLLMSVALSIRNNENSTAVFKGDREISINYGLSFMSGDIEKVYKYVVEFIKRFNETV